MITLIRLASMIAMLFSMAACVNKKLNLVIIGGGFAGNKIPELYEAAVEEQMGVEANTFSWVRVNEKPDAFLENLRVNTELREAVANADIILLTISPNWSNSAELRYILGTCGGEDNQDCLRETLAATKCSWKGIMDTFAELRAGEPVIFQVVLWSDWIFPAYHGDDATPEQLAVMASYFNKFQEFQVTTLGIQFTTVFPETDDELSPEYFRTDGSHQLSEAGSRAAVELLVATGFEKTTPGSPDMSNANVDCTSISQ
jgi:hypothetical protein